MDGWAADPLLRGVWVAARDRALSRGDLATETLHVLLALLDMTPAEGLAARGIDAAAVAARADARLAARRSPSARLMGGKPGVLTPRARVALRAAAARAAVAGARPDWTTCGPG